MVDLHMELVIRLLLLVLVVLLVCQGYVTVEEIHNSVGDVIRIDGIRDEIFKDYNNLYKIESIESGNDSQINVSSASTIFAEYPFIGTKDIVGVNTNGLTNVSAAVLSDVTAYLVSESIGITSITYDNNSGIASVTSTNSHGLLVGNNIKIGGLPSDVLNGDFTVESVLSVKNFTLNVGSGSTVVNPTGGGTIYIKGIAAQADSIDFNDESSSARLVPTYAGITSSLSAGLTDPTLNTLTVQCVGHGMGCW